MSDRQELRPVRNHVTAAEWQDFNQRHSVDGPRIPDPQTEGDLFPDGARITSIGEILEPPTDAAQCTRLRYRWAKLTLATHEFNWKKFKADCEARLLNRARFGNVQPPPAADYQTQLANGLVLIKALREKIRKLDQEVAALPKERSQREYQEARQREAAQANQELTYLAGLQL